MEKLTPRSTLAQVRLLTVDEFEAQFAALPFIKDRETRFAIVMDLFWTALSLPMSPENDRRQDRLESACANAGIPFIVPFKMCADLKRAARMVCN